MPRTITQTVASRCRESAARNVRRQVRSFQELLSGCVSWDVDDLQLDPVGVVEEDRVVAGRCTRTPRPALDLDAALAQPAAPARRRRARDGASKREVVEADRGSGRTARPVASASRGGRASFPGPRCTRSSRRARPRPRRCRGSRAAPGARGRTAGCARSRRRRGRRGGRRWSAAGGTPSTRLFQLLRPAVANRPANRTRGSSAALEQTLALLALRARSRRNSHASATIVTSEPSTIITLPASRWSSMRRDARAAARLLVERVEDACSARRRRCRARSRRRGRRRRSRASLPCRTTRASEWPRARASTSASPPVKKHACSSACSPSRAQRRLVERPAGARRRGSTAQIGSADGRMRRKRRRITRRKREQRPQQRPRQPARAMQSGARSPSRMCCTMCAKKNCSLAEGVDRRRDREERRARARGRSTSWRQRVDRRAAGGERPPRAGSRGSPRRDQEERRGVERPAGQGRAPDLGLVRAPARVVGGSGSSGRRRSPSRAAARRCGGSRRGAARAALGSSVVGLIGEPLLHRPPVQALVAVPVVLGGGDDPRQRPSLPARAAPAVSGAGRSPRDRRRPGAASCARTAPDRDEAAGPDRPERAAAASAIVPQTNAAPMPAPRPRVGLEHEPRLADADLEESEDQSRARSGPRRRQPAELDPDPAAKARARMVAELPEPNATSSAALRVKRRSIPSSGSSPR